MRGVMLAMCLAIALLTVQVLMLGAALNHTQKVVNGLQLEINYIETHYRPTPVSPPSMIRFRP
jgi:hypothetical protein